MVQKDLLLEAKGLKTHFPLDEGLVRAVDGVDFRIHRRETVGIVGESGCGKTITGRSILQIVDPPGRIVEGEIIYYRYDRSDQAGAREEIRLSDLDPTGREIREIRGCEISMIFQEPLTSFSPVHTVGNQMIEAVRLHSSASKGEARDIVVRMLQRVGIPRAELRIDDYPFQLSGGMRQRTMIAMALLCRPSLLIADEPTTALDVTTQAQILDLMIELQEELGMAIMMVTHDLGVVAEVADSVVVMYLGLVAERGDVDSIFHDPRHPYTRALLRSIPKVGLRSRERLNTIRGMVPDPYHRPQGCVFHPRCDETIPGLCDKKAPERLVLGEEREVRCWLYASSGTE